LHRAFFAITARIMMRNPTKSGVFEAYKKVASVVPQTPLLAHKSGDDTLWLKCESDQPVGAFKLRGAWHRLTALSEAERRAGVVAFSSGNHAQGVAWAAQKLDMDAVIVMPSDAPTLKIEGTKRLGAQVILYDRYTESREAIAMALAQERGAVLVPSFDDPWIVEGQGSAGVEACAQMAALGINAPDLVIAPCGGGGLAAGLALALPDAQIVIVEPDGWDDMGQSLRRGSIVPVGPNPPKTTCDALQTMRVAPITFDILHARDATALSVSEAEVFAAMRYAWRVLGKMVEPGGAVGLAAVLCGKIKPGLRTLIMLSGGNVDPELHDHVVKSP
jgi:threonine dehydratase